MISFRRYILTLIIALLPFSLNAASSEVLHTHKDTAAALSKDLLAHQDQLDALLAEQGQVKAGTKYLAPLLAKTTQVPTNRAFLPRFLSQLVSGVNFQASEAPTQPLLDLLANTTGDDTFSAEEAAKLSDTTHELYRQSLLNFFTSQKKVTSEDKVAFTNALDELFFHPTFGTDLRPSLTNLSAHVISLYRSNLRDGSKKKNLDALLQQYRKEMIAIMRTVGKGDTDLPLIALHTLTTSIEKAANWFPKRRVVKKLRTALRILAFITALAAAGVLVYYRKPVMNLMRSVPHDVYHLIRSTPLWRNEILKPSDLRTVKNGWVSGETALEWIDVANPLATALREQEAAEMGPVLAARHAHKMAELDRTAAAARARLTGEIPFAQTRLDEQFGAEPQAALAAPRDALAAHVTRDGLIRTQLATDIPAARQERDLAQTHLQILLDDPATSDGTLRTAVNRVRTTQKVLDRRERKTEELNPVVTSRQQTKLDLLNRRLAHMTEHYEARNTALAQAREARAAQASEQQRAALADALEAERAAAVLAHRIPLPENEHLARRAKERRLYEESNIQHVAAGATAAEQAMTSTNWAHRRSQLGDAGLVTANAVFDTAASGIIRPLETVASTFTGFARRGKESRFHDAGRFARGAALSYTRNEREESRIKDDVARTAAELNAAKQAAQAATTDSAALAQKQRTAVIAQRRHAAHAHLAERQKAVSDALAAYKNAAERYQFHKELAVEHEDSTTDGLAAATATRAAEAERTMLAAMRAFEAAKEARDTVQSHINKAEMKQTVRGALHALPDAARRWQAQRALRKERNTEEARRSTFTGIAGKITADIATAQAAIKQLDQERAARIARKKVLKARGTKVFEDKIRDEAILAGQQRKALRAYQAALIELQKEQPAMQEAQEWVARVRAEPVSVAQQEELKKARVARDAQQQTFGARLAAVNEQARAIKAAKAAGRKAELWDRATFGPTQRAAAQTVEQIGRGWKGLTWNKVKQVFATGGQAADEGADLVGPVDAPAAVVAADPTPAPTGPRRRRRR